MMRSFLPKQIILALFLFIAACTPTTSFESIKADNYDLNPHRVLIIEKMGMGPQQQQFTASFMTKMKACGKIIDTSIISSGLTTESARETFQRLIAEAVKTGHPDAILEVNETARMTLYRNGVSMGNKDYKYDLILKNMEGKKMWMAQLDVKLHLADDNGYAGVVMANDTVTKMLQDGVISGCPITVSE